MKVVPFEKRDENEVAAPIPEVPANLYGEIFLAADWAILNRPWEQAEAGLLFEVADSTGQEAWQAFLNGEGGVSALLLVRRNGAKVSGDHERLEVQFIASDFLQGHDYELNVRYAPESWDECEQDVLVLRAYDCEREPDHPNREQVKILSEGLRKLQESGEAVSSK